MSSSRYYDDKDDEITPGKISAELRAALNLAENDLPIWIYRMRAIGYPPGWLRKAVVDTSDIFERDSPPPAENSDAVGKNEGSGKRKGGPDRDETKYDHSKLIEYPGFNTPLPPNTHDYHYYFNMPPMMPHQQLDYAKKMMSEPTPGVPAPKRTRPSMESTSKKVSDDGTANEEDNSMIPPDEESPASPDPESYETVNNSAAVAPSNLDKTNDESPTDKKLDKSMNSDVKNKSSLSLNSSLNESIKLVSRGSPMPKPVERITLERFSEGVVGELLYFENIPNSTGKFSSIRGLLNTMRRSKSESLVNSSFTEEPTSNSSKKLED